MSEIDRRQFVKNVMLGGAALGLASTMFPASLAAARAAPQDIGQCKSVKITSVSEVGWWDTGRLFADTMPSGGPMGADQWTTEWSASNTAGCCSLIEVKGLDGKTTRILLDTGWNSQYMAWRFAATGVDKLLKANGIDYLVISHEHADHFFGLDACLDLNPKVTMVVPATMRPEGLGFIAGEKSKSVTVHNPIKHQGKLMSTKPGGVIKLFSGAGLALFDVPMAFKVRGEQSLIINVKDKGLVLVSGCCHQGITDFANYAKNMVAGHDKLYGLYGGLHIAPMGALNKSGEKMVRDLAGYGFEKMACNHCTGLAAVKLMKELKYPVVKGSGSQGSKSDLYVGNGDSVTFG